MAEKKLEKAKWEEYFNNLSKRLKEEKAEVEVEAFGVFDHIEAEWLPIVGISYDPKDDIFSIYMENEKGDNLDHIIHTPEEVDLEFQDDKLKAVEIMGGDGGKTVIKFKEAIAV
jgi:hypothetical protein